MNVPTRQRVIDAISRVQKTTITENMMSLTLEELGMDSFDAINLFFALEDEFNIELPDEAKNYKNIEDVILGVEALLDNELAIDAS